MNRNDGTEGRGIGVYRVEYVDRTGNRGISTTYAVGRLDDLRDYYGKQPCFQDCSLTFTPVPCMVLL